VEAARLHAEAVARVAAAKALRDKQASSAAVAAATLRANIDSEAQRTCDNMNRSAPGSVRSCKQLDSTVMLITVDADDYDAFGPQDQKLIRVGYFKHWVDVWEADHPGKEDEAQLSLILQDLVGNHLGSMSFYELRSH
jgi:hypothetical protein